MARFPVIRVQFKRGKQAHRMFSKKQKFVCSMTAESDGQP